MSHCLRCCWGLTVPAILLGLALRGSAATEDPQRRLEIQVELAWLADPLVCCYYPCARVEGNKLLIEGYLPSEAVREQAFKLARQHSSLPVVDQLKVHPGVVVQRTRVPADQIIRAATVALRVAFPEDHPRLLLGSLDNGQVTVSGSVPSWEKKLQISQCLRRLPGVSHVVNRTEVPEPPTKTGLEKAPVASAASPAVASPASSPLANDAARNPTIWTARRGMAESETNTSAVHPRVTLGPQVEPVPTSGAPASAAVAGDPGANGALTVWQSGSPPVPAATIPTAQTEPTPMPVARPTPALPSPTLEPPLDSPLPTPAAPSEVERPVPVPASTTQAEGKQDQPSFPPVHRTEPEPPSPVPEPTPKMEFQFSAVSSRWVPRSAMALPLARSRPLTQSAPAEGEPYVSEGMVARPVPVAPATSPGAGQNLQWVLQQRCGPAARHLSVYWLTASRLRILFSAPTEAEADRLVGVILSTPELAPYQVDLTISVGQGE